MSLEAAIAELNDNIKALTSAMKSTRAATTDAEPQAKPANKTQTSKPAATSAVTSPANAKEQPASTSSTGPSQAQVKEVVLKLLKIEGGRDKASKILGKYDGAVNVTTLKAEHYAAALEELSAALKSADDVAG